MSTPAITLDGIEEAAPEEIRDLSSLDQLPFGTQARVVGVDGTNSIARRLMEMGIVPGAPICVVKEGPMGDPLLINVRRYQLALRRSEAQAITVVLQRSQ